MQDQWRIQKNSDRGGRRNLYSKAQATPAPPPQNRMKNPLQRRLSIQFFENTRKKGGARPPRPLPKSAPEDRLFVFQLVHGFEC